MRPRCSATTSHCSEGVRMYARSVWFRETGEGRPKEQLLIETMFCVYYLSKGSAVPETRALLLQPPFLNTFSLSVPSFGSRTSPVGHRQRVSRPARQASSRSLPPCLILTPSAISPAPTGPVRAGEHERRPQGRRRGVSRPPKATFQGQISWRDARVNPPHEKIAESSRTSATKAKTKPL